MKIIIILVVVEDRAIGLKSRVFANSPGDQSSIPSRVIPKTALLNTQHYKVRVKWTNPVNGVIPSPTPRRCSFW